MYNVFISYAREDGEFTHHLKEALEATDRKVWVDVDGAYGGDEFWPQICTAIEKADAFVFVISPVSAVSRFCRQEIAHAVHHNKRIVPVVYRAADAHTLPGIIAAKQWIYLRDHDPFDQAFASLIEAIDSDLPWLIDHTRILTHAIDWDTRGRENSYLLRGHGLLDAEQWLAGSTGKEPVPTPLQTQFIVASRRIATKRQRMLLSSVTLGLVVSVVLSIVAFYQYRLSEIRGQTAHGRLLASQATDRLDTQLDLSMLLSLEAYRVHPSEETKSNVLAGLLHNPRLRTFLRGHKNIVEALAFSSDGKWLASGSRDQTIILWNLQTMIPHAPPLSGHKATVIALTFATDGQQLISVDADGGVIFWDLTTRKALDQVKSGHPEGLISAVFSHDRNTLAMAGRYSITLWNLSTKTRKGQRIYGPVFLVDGLSFSPDGRRLLSADSRTGIIEWDVETQQPIGDPIKAGSEVLSVAYAPDGALMASGTRWVTLWDMASRQPLGEPLRGHDSSMGEMRFSPDGSLLASGNLDGTVRLWNVKNRTLNTLLSVGNERSSGALAFTDDGGQLASAGSNGDIHLWDVKPGLTHQQVLAGHEETIKSVAFSANGKTMASGAADGTVILWDRATGQPQGQPLRGHDDGDVVALVFSPDSTLLVSGSIGWTSTIRFWDLETGLTIGPPRADHQVPNRPHGVFVAEFGPLGKRLATGGWDGMVRLWSGEPLTVQGEAMGGHQGSVISLTFSPDGTRLASGDGVGGIRLWDTATGDLVSEQAHGKNNGVVGLAFTADGRHLISVDGDGTIIIWESSINEEIQRLNPNAENKVYAVAFSPDGSRLASLNQGGAIWLWNMDTLERLDNPLRSASAAYFAVLPAWNALAFSPDGTQLASAALGDEISLWDVDPGSWRTRACSRTNRNLTRAEWHQFIGPGTPYQLTCQDLPAGGANGNQ